nr:hypothetical protein [Tanacetum cinerariifolium]
MRNDQINANNAAKNMYNLDVIKDAEQIWDRVKLLIQGSELSFQERESKLYDDFDTFTSMPGEMLFAQLINDMHTIGYRLNPRYTIKECSSCGTLYIRDCVCSKGNVEDKILVPKPPKHCAKCTRCGYLVDGLNCQGCALLRQKLEENLVTHSQDFQNTFESSNASTNVVNAPREPFVVKQDHGIS